MTIGRLRIYFEPRDAWIGLYVAPSALYFCPLPFLVVKLSRTTQPEATA